MFKVTSSGSFEKTEAWLKRMSSVNNELARLEHLGKEGVAALSAATPRESGVTAAAWSYEIIQKNGSWSIVWGNSHVVDGRQIAILLQYGHGTRTGGYVAPRDYINPALRPIMDRAVADGWKVVTEQ